MWILSWIQQIDNFEVDICIKIEVYLNKIQILINLK